MSDVATGAGSSDPEEELETLRREVERLRARVSELERERLALLRAAANRDYERPPHYL